MLCPEKKKKNEWRHFSLLRSLGVGGGKHGSSEAQWEVCFPLFHPTCQKSPITIIIISYCLPRRAWRGTAWQELGVLEIEEWFGPDRPRWRRITTNPMPGMEENSVYLNEDKKKIPISLLFTPCQDWMCKPWADQLCRHSQWWCRTRTWRQVCVAEDTWWGSWWWGRPCGCDAWQSLDTGGY